MGEKKITILTRTTLSKLAKMFTLVLDSDNITITKHKEVLDSDFLFLHLLFFLYYKTSI